MFFFSKFFGILKSSLSTLLALIVAVSQGGPIAISLHGVRSTPLSIYSYSFYDPTVKVMRDGTIANNRSYTMYAAKNENEFCQFAFRTNKRRGHSYFEITDFENENGDIIPIELYKECAVETTDGVFNTKYYDALVPSEKAFHFSTKIEFNYVYAVNIRTSVDTVPGDYTATIRIGNYDIPDNKYENETATLKLHVWDFTLPDTPSMDTAMGLEHYDIGLKHNVGAGTQAYNDLYKKYYDFLLEHKISAYDMPYDILDSRADAYMSDPRVKSFRIPYGNDDTIRAYYNKLSQNPEWMKKAYFYPIDEPDSPEDVESYNKICERLASLFPGYNMVTPFYTNDINDVDEQNIDIQQGKSNIICPETELFSKKEFCEKVRNRVEGGDKVWWYVCCGPRPDSDYCNLFVQQSALKHRILFWQQKQYNVTGLLYWDTNYWRDAQLSDGTPASDVWESSWTTPWTGNDTFGDGSLLYNGNKVGINGPVSSLRLESVTNGIEDYEYLVMAESLLGKDKADKMLSKVTASLTDFTYSDKAFRNARINLGNAIEKASK